MNGITEHTKIIACSMIEDELNLVMERHGCALPVIWIERWLHESIRLLRDEIDKAIAGMPDADTILLAMGICGNALEGLSNEHARIIVPRFPDCISMQLNGPKRMDYFYYTRGWLKGDRVLTKMYTDAVEKHGEKKAKKAFSVLLKNYSAISMVDTRAYPMAEACDLVRPFAELLEKELLTVPGNTDILERLILGEWDDERFCVIEKGERVNTLELLQGQEAHFPVF